MVDKYINFEWYVLNGDFNSDEIKPFNIFNNWVLCDAVNKLCKDYKRKKMTFEEFTEELRSLIMWQEWSRCEYEILVCNLIGEKKNYQKIDCYAQALPNIKIIAKYVLEEYYPRLKIKGLTKEKDDIEKDIKSEEKID